MRVRSWLGVVGRLWRDNAPSVGGDVVITGTKASHGTDYPTEGGNFGSEIMI